MNTHDPRPLIPSFQADPGEHYALYTLALYSGATQSNGLLQLISTNSLMRPPSPLLAGKEVWNVSGAFLSSVGTATQLVIEGAESVEPPTFALSEDYDLFTMDAAVSWASSEPPFPQAAFFGIGDRGGLGVLFSLTPPAQHGQSWTGSIQWFFGPSGGGSPGPYAFGSSSTITLARTVPTQFNAWYAVSLAPVTLT